ncbi:hypothetical protein PR048_015686 [Dryococelus australis]|uniref:Transposase n=1 Tax=Dryococelus australis TaxID=614101 RepID=A0ABQ9HHM2_9NEOP|nr:hypothetical protein PR048_015686 [Dryococelus australis]
MYCERYHERKCPHYQTFTAIHDRLGDTGTLRISKPNEKEVLLCIENSPSRCTRAIAMELDVHHSSVWTMLREHLFQPFHTKRIQVMRPDDYPHRLEFQRWFLQQANEDPRIFGMRAVYRTCKLAYKIPGPHHIGLLPVGIRESLTVDSEMKLVPQTHEVAAITQDNPTLPSEHRTSSTMLPTLQ